MANDEPPYLELGTEVSAKYRGAFCEAKVKTLKRCVRVKVSFSKGQTTVVDSNAIKEGTMKVGSKVVVKQQDGTLAPGTVVRLTDASWYTVVFDDGDERTLKRSSLVLKGGRHYQESETLDTLPLTNPEYFSTPVGPVRKTRKKAGLGVGSPSSDSATDSPMTSPAKRRRKKGFEIGQVVFLENNERRKAAWLPAVVVPAAFVGEDTDPDDNSTYIRSFKDGRFYAVDAKELHEFSARTEPLAGVLRGGLQPTHKAAIDKAMVYIDTGDLPWDMDLPPDARLRQKVADAAVSIPEESDGSESSSDSPEEEEEEEEEEEARDADGDSDSKEDESESSEGEEVDVTTNKKRFMENLRKLHQKRGTPIIRHPVLGQKDVDLYQLHQYVTDYGGMEKVTQDLKWRSIYLRLGLPPSQTNCSSAIKQAYKRYLLPLEEGAQKDHEDVEKGTKKQGKEREKMDKEPVKVAKPKGRPRKHAGKMAKEPAKSPVKETGRQLRETGRQSIEKDRPLKETGRQPKETEKQSKETGRQSKLTDRQSREADKQVKETSRPVTGAGKAAKEAGQRHLRESDKQTKVKQGSLVDSPEKKVDKVGARQVKEKGKLEKGEADAVKRKKEESKKASSVKEESLESVRPEKKQSSAVVESDSSSSETPTGKGQEEDSSNLSSEDKSAAAPAVGEALYKEDDKVLVWYGRGKNLRTYEAKIVSCVYESSLAAFVYYVHYNGWNKRYNEWVIESRIHEKASGNVFNEKWQSKYTKRPQARRSLTSSKSCDEPEEESPSNRAEKKPAKKAGRRPKKLGIARQKSEPVISKAAVKEEDEDAREEAGSSETSPAVVRQALSAPSAIPGIVKSSPGAHPPPEKASTEPLVSPEKSDDEAPLEKPIWGQSTSPSASQPHLADAGTVSPLTNDEEDEKMDQDGASSPFDHPAGADEDATPVSSQWDKEDSSSDTMEQVDKPFKGFLRLEEAGEESQLTSDGEESTSSDTDEEDAVDPSFMAEPMERGPSPSPEEEEQESKENDPTTPTKPPVEDKSRTELPKWIPVPPAVVPESESERKEDFSDTTANGAAPNSPFIFPNVVSAREKSTPSSSEDMSRTEELLSSDQEQGQSGNMNSGVGEDPSNVEPCEKRGKGRPLGRGSPDIRRKLKRVSSSEGEPPRKRIADLPDDETNPWRVDFSASPEMSATDRIQVILDKMREMRRCYSHLKTAVNHIERKKRRAKRKEKESMAHAQAQQLIQSLVEFT